MCEIIDNPSHKIQNAYHQHNNNNTIHVSKDTVDERNVKES